MTNQNACHRILTSFSRHVKKLRIWLKDGATIYFQSLLVISYQQRRSMEEKIWRKLLTGKCKRYFYCSHADRTFIARHFRDALNVKKYYYNIYNLFIFHRKMRIGTEPCGNISSSDASFFIRNKKGSTCHFRDGHFRDVTALTDVTWNDNVVQKITTSSRKWHMSEIFFLITLKCWNTFLFWFKICLMSDKFYI